MSSVTIERGTRMPLRPWQDRQGLPSLFELGVMVGVVFILASDDPRLWFTDFISEDGTVVTSNAVGGVAVVIFAAVAYAFLRYGLRLDGFLWVAQVEILVPVFMGWAVLSFLWSSDPFRSVEQAGSLVLIALLAYFFVCRYRPTEVLGIIATALLVSMVFHYAFVFVLPEYGTDPEGDQVDMRKMILKL